MGRMIRTFVGLALPDVVRRRLADLIGRWRSGVSSGVRWVHPDNLHVTLNFLGDTPQEKLGTISRMVMDAAAGVAPFRVAIEGLGCFPPKGRSRVVWAGLSQGAEPLAEIHGRINDAVVEEGLRVERRRYVPHVTLGRISSGGSDTIGSLVDQAGGTAYGLFEAQAVTYYSSDLEKGGPVYAVLATAPLGGASSV